MMGDPADVARQYATASLVERIDAALAHAGLTATWLRSTISTRAAPPRPRNWRRRSPPSQELT